MARVVDVAVHHRRARAQPDPVGGGDHVDPGAGRELALREHPPHLVVEDLRGRAGDRVEPGLAGLDQEVLDRQAGAAGAVDDLHRRERVDVHLRHPALHRGDQVEVGGAGELGVDAALHAHLGRAELPRLLGAVGDLLQRQGVRVGVGAPLGERAEPAADVADVGEVDVAVDDVGHLVADGLPPQVVGQPADLVEQARRPPSSAPAPARRSAPPGPAPPPAARMAPRESRCRDVGLRAAGPPRGPPPRAPRPSRRRPSRSRRDGRPVRPEVSTAVCRSVRPTAGEAAVRLLPRQAHGSYADLRQPVVGRQRRHVGRDPRVEPRLAGPDVLRVHGQPRPQLEPGGRRQRRQPLQRGPRPLRVDVVGGQRRDAAPVVDAGAQQRSALRARRPGWAAPAPGHADRAPAG